MAPDRAEYSRMAQALLLRTASPAYRDGSVGPMDHPHLTGSEHLRTGIQYLLLVHMSSSLSLSTLAPGIPCSRHRGT